MGDIFYNVYKIWYNLYVMKKLREIKISPYFTIILTFLGVILIGSILLVLPISTTKGHIDYIDALFMSTSSVCVTGLSVMNNIAVDFTIFGQSIIVLLMFIGGLGFLTISTFFLMILGAKFGMTDRYLLKEAWNADSTKGIFKLVRNIVIFSVGVQLLGTIINYFIIREIVPENTFWVALFHSVSAFNNVGFDILGNSNSLIGFSNNVVLNISTMLLIIIGGLGFVTIFDVIKNHSWKKFSLTTKIIMIVVPILIVSGMLLIKLADYKNITWLQALFTSVASRTAGFTTVDFSTISTASIIIILILMFIGGAPCSVAGGIKVTTFSVLLIGTFNYSTGRQPVIFKRTISEKTIKKAFSLFVISILYIMMVSMLIALLNPQLPMRAVFMEVVSAFATVGFSINATPTLTVFSKLLIIFTMFFGRLGPLTIMNINNNDWLHEDVKEIKYIEEDIKVG